MIVDGDKHTFKAVLVYQLDRFARNRYDGAINKVKLRKNSICYFRDIADDASVILVEGVLESMAEYYSTERSQKIRRRGINISAEKCLSKGSNPGLGDSVDAARFHIDQERAATVWESFEMYASRKTVAEITKYFNERQAKTFLGKEFNKNSLRSFWETSGISVIISTRTLKRQNDDRLRWHREIGYILPLLRLQKHQEKVLSKESSQQVEDWG